MRLTACDESWEIVKNVLASVKRQMVPNGGNSGRPNAARVHLYRALGFSAGSGVLGALNLPQV